MNLVIIIPTYNRKNLIEKVLQQISLQKIEKYISVSTIVVNDGSSDGTSEILAKNFPDVHIVQGTGNWWYTKSMNKGFKYAEKLKPDYILTLNDDLEIHPGYLQKLINATKEVEDNSIIGSISLTIEKPHRLFFSGVKNTNFNTYNSERYHKQFAEIKPNELTGTYPTTQLPGRGMLIPYKVLKALNFFDEKFIQYGSDSDFCFTALKKGIKIYISWDAVIYSHWKETGKGSPFLKENIFQYSQNVFFNRYSARYIGNSFRMIYKHYNRKQLPVFFMKALASKYSAFFKHKKQ